MTKTFISDNATEQLNLNLARFKFAFVTAKLLFPDGGTVSYVDPVFNNADLTRLIDRAASNPRATLVQLQVLVPANDAAADLMYDFGAANEKTMNLGKLIGFRKDIFRNGFDTGMVTVYEDSELYDKYSEASRAAQIARKAQSPTDRAAERLLQSLRNQH